MPTYDELRNETGAAAGMWNAEKQSASMKTLSLRLREFYQVPVGNIGSKGDNAPGHMRGAHRSRNWILNSVYCTNRTYTVTETPGNRSGGDGDWLAGLDITIPRDALIAACQRLDVAVRAGVLEKVTEWYGNKDGDLRVDGYDNIRNVVASSDSSHLWHLHLTFDRGRCGEDHTDVYEILTGVDMLPDERTWLKDLHYATFTADSAVRDPKSLAGKLERVETMLEQVLAKLNAPPPPEHLAAVAAAAKEGAEAGAPTHEELVAAATEGANQAEDS